ncbi:DUF1064 domain-containing protein [Paenibacillus ehimensis]|uniref:DUF1064 domain-containing protein n=1 Tax=Paenibacillus ehimensis TaxID=79264 RepID=UPI003D2E8B6C
MMRSKNKRQDNGEEKSKYNAKKTILKPDGKIHKVSVSELKEMKLRGLPEGAIVFDSELEARFYRDELKPRIEKGLIQVEMQPKFTLLEKFEVKNDKQHIKHQAITYTPDFKVTRLATGKVTLIDVKGAEDQKFPIKRKLFDSKFPELAPLVVMKHCVKFGGWITIEEYTKQKREEKKIKKDA